jgi:hypothetical protein
MSGDLSVSPNFLIITENDEYCSSLSISSGSLKLEIDILKSVFV